MIGWRRGQVGAEPRGRRFGSNRSRSDFAASLCTGVNVVVHLCLITAYRRRTVPRRAARRAVWKPLYCSVSDLLCEWRGFESQSWECSVKVLGKFPLSRCLRREAANSVPTEGVWCSLVAKTTAGFWRGLVAHRVQLSGRFNAGKETYTHQHVFLISLQPSQSVAFIHNYKGPQITKLKVHRRRKRFFCVCEMPPSECVVPYYPCLRRKFLLNF